MHQRLNHKFRKKKENLTQRCSGILNKLFEKLHVLCFFQILVLKKLALYVKKEKKSINLFPINPIFLVCFIKRK